MKLTNYHEVINDVIGDTPVVVAWSAMADAPSAMRRTLPNGTVLSFGSAGLIYQGGIVLFDTQSESLWSPFTRVGLTGAHVGTPLPPVQTVLTTWQAWKRRHPETSAFVHTEPLLRLNYEANPAVPSAEYLQNQRLYYPVYGYDIGASPMKLKEPVFGVIGINGTAARAYPLKLLRETEGPFEDTLNGRAIRLNYDLSMDHLEAMDGDTALLTETCFWINWVGVHPKTEVWQADKLNAPFAEEEIAPAQ